MKPEIKELLSISNFYGSRPEYVIAGGGNTSFKDSETIWIKASGEPLSSLDEKGLVAMNREKLKVISRKTYSEDPVKREEEVKQDLNSAINDSQPSKRPSVETSLHELIGYKFVVHLHPTIINGLLCSRNARKLTEKLFSESALFIPYIDPGYTLFKKLETDILAYRKNHGNDPKVILLENHGSFVAADTTEEVRSIYDNIIGKIAEEAGEQEVIARVPHNDVMHKALPAMRMLLASENPAVIRFRNNSLLQKYCKNQQEFHKISMPLTPDIIVYCKARYIYIDHSSSAEKIIESLKYQLPNFKNEYGYPPKVIAVKDAGVFAISESYSAAETILDVFEDMVKVVDLAGQLGGVKYLTPEQVSFIDNWEVENYRRKVSKGSLTGNRLANRTAIVTGGGQGFGAGIAEALAAMNMNVVVADLNEKTGTALVAKLNETKRTSRVVFARTDVADALSAEEMVKTCVREFGGLDILVSNAGVLRAGGLEEMEPDVFSMTTDVNYKGYFLCTKYASEVLKIQNNENPGYFSDIIQVNSKSGLRGSNRNFAYAGAKFGGIGLTQSFALELAPYRIKVNSICPGNFYEGPLWSDPVNGLFVQYLKTGKVPGARNIDDVRKFYEDQVPLRRGCRLEDVMKAILYVVDQEYETGQAIPVTGGQVMLG